MTRQMTRQMTLRIVGLALAGLIVAGCTSTKQKAEPVTPATTPPPAVEQPAPPPAEPPKAAVNGPVDENGNAVGSTIYFDFDSANINAEGQKLVGYHAKYLSANGGQKVSIEGNCDERGTPEYNLALGERRANAVKEGLVGGGVGAGQLDSVSFGEEKPVDAGHDESAWSKNRRAELNYKR